MDTSTTTSHCYELYSDSLTPNEKFWVRAAIKLCISYCCLVVLHAWISRLSTPTPTLQEIKISLRPFKPNRNVVEPPKEDVHGVIERSIWDDLQSRRYDWFNWAMIASLGPLHLIQLIYYVFPSYYEAHIEALMLFSLVAIGIGLAAAVADFTLGVLTRIEDIIYGAIVLIMDYSIARDASAARQMEKDTTEPVYSDEENEEALDEEEEEEEHEEVVGGY
ncbi:hypothetical protein FSARC_11196 [Fusarium sarcochroum]|uniref:Transmembrane protein n=1 Tax=Fusarium sarcochroum TaxID=1208366 RepID=A0A8H4TGT3_9HYPO|nr:hypothetical protein FSARC_11196 [Fusarium sarcochroum]